MEFKLGDWLVFEWQYYNDGPVLQTKKECDLVKRIDDKYVYGADFYYEKATNTWYRNINGVASQFNYLTGVYRRNSVNELEKIYTHEIYTR